MGLISSFGRASASMNRLPFRYCRASHRPISPVDNRCFSTDPHGEELFRHIQPNNEIFTPLIPDAFSVPDGFPFQIESGGPRRISLRRSYGKEIIIIQVETIFFGGNMLLHASGVVFNDRRQCMKFRMKASRDEVVFSIISISDAHSRYVEGSDKYLETKGIKPSTIKVLFDYLRNRMIPGHDEFPFEIKNGLEKGTLTLRRKCEDEIIIVDVRAVDEHRVFDELADFEAHISLKGLRHSLDCHNKYDFEDYMKMFDEDTEAGNEVEVEDIGCLFMTVRIFYGFSYSKSIKLTVFAFPNQIAVPQITLTDYSDSALEPYDAPLKVGGTGGLKAFNAYFKDRGIHPGTMNILRNYFPNHAELDEPKPKIFGRFDGLLMEVEVESQAKKRLMAEYHKCTTD